MGSNRQHGMQRVMPVFCSLLVNGVLALCLVRLAAAPAAAPIEMTVELAPALTVEDASAPPVPQDIPDFEPPAPPPPAPRPLDQPPAPKTVEEILKAFPMPAPRPNPQPEPPRVIEEPPPPVPALPSPVTEVTPSPPPPAPTRIIAEMPTPAPAGPLPDLPRVGPASRPGSGDGAPARGGADGPGFDGGGTRATGPGAAVRGGDGDGSGTGAPGTGTPGGNGPRGSGTGNSGTGTPGFTEMPRVDPPKPKAEPPSPPPPPDHPPAPKVVRPAAVTRATEPRYPAAARRDGAEGTALVRVYLDAKGKVTDVEIVTSTGDSRLDAAALAEVKARWRFTPRYEDNTPIASAVKARLEFRLNR